MNIIEFYNKIKRCRIDFIRDFKFEKNEYYIKSRLDVSNLEENRFFLKDIIKERLKIWYEDSGQNKKITNFYPFLQRIQAENFILCESCKKNKGIQVHHIDKNMKNNKLENLELLCKSCHILKHYGYPTRRTKTP